MSERNEVIEESSVFLNRNQSTNRFRRHTTRQYRGGGRTGPSGGRGSGGGQYKQRRNQRKKNHEQGRTRSEDVRLKPIVAAIENGWMDPFREQLLAFSSELRSEMRISDQHTILTLICDREWSAIQIQMTKFVVNVSLFNKLLYIENNHGKLPVEIAAERLNVELCKVLLDFMKGEMWNSMSSAKYGQCMHAALHAALAKAQQPKSRADIDQPLVDVLDSIIQHAKEQFNDSKWHWNDIINARNEHGETLLLVACKLASINVVKLLMTNQADPRIKCSKGMSATHALEKKYATFEGKVKHSPVDLKGGTSSEEFQPIFEILLIFIEYQGIQEVFCVDSSLGMKSKTLKNIILSHFGISFIMDKAADELYFRNGVNKYLNCTMDHIAGLYRQLKSPRNKVEILLLTWQYAIEPRALYPYFPFQNSTLISIVKSLCHDQTNAKTIRTWICILSELYNFYTTPTIPTVYSPIHVFHTKEWYQSLIAQLEISVHKLLFNILNADDVDGDEYLYNQYMARLELFLYTYVPHCYILSQSEDFSDIFKEICQPLRQLYHVLSIVFSAIDGVLKYPARIAIVLHTLQIVAYLEEAVQSPNNDLQSIYESLSKCIKREIWKEVYTGGYIRNHNLRSITSRFLFPFAPRFKEWIVTHQAVVNFLVQSDPMILRVHFEDYLKLENFITSQNKVNYICAYSDERHFGRLNITLNRYSTRNTIEFLVQQVLSAKTRDLVGDLTVVFLNEPGVGVGPIRECFELISRYFFNPHFNIDQEVELPPPPPSTSMIYHPLVESIGLNWLQRARDQTLTQIRFQVNVSNIVTPAPSTSTPIPPPTTTPPPPPTNPSTTAANIQFKSSFNSYYANLPLFETVVVNNTQYAQLKNRPLKVTQAPNIIDGVVRQVPYTNIVRSGQKSNKRYTSNSQYRTTNYNGLYRVIGRFIGLSIRHQQPLGIRFPIIFWKCILNEHLTWKVYSGEDSNMLKSLQAIIDFDFSIFKQEDEVDNDRMNSNRNSIDDHPYADLRFEYCTSVCYDDRSNSNKQYIEIAEVEFDPVDNVVTNENKSKYVELKAKLLFHRNMETELIEIRKGIHDVIFKPNLEIFTAIELQSIVAGTDVINRQDLEQYVEYGRNASPSNRIIIYFWKIVHEMSEKELELLLIFWSGSSHPPMFGFHLDHYDDTSPAWSIDIASVKPELFPQANTCDRKLILREYPSKQVLKDKLLVAIQYGAFGYDRM